MKNLNLPLALGAAFLFAATTPSSAQLFLNFDSDMPGTAPSTPTGVSFATGGNGTALVSSAASVSPSNSLDFSTPNTAGDYTEGIFFGSPITADLAAPTTVSFNLLLPDTTTDFYFSVGDTAGSPVDQVAFVGGEFYGYDGTTPGATALGTYSANTFYTVQLNVNPSNQTFTTDLVTPGGTVFDSSSSLASLSANTLGSLIFEAVPTGSTGTVDDYVDNVDIAASAPEPGSFALLTLGSGLLLAFRLIMRKRVSSPSPFENAGLTSNL